MMDAAIQNAMSLAQMGAQPSSVGLPQHSANYQTAKKAAQEFEGVFATQFLSQMFEGIKTDGMFGGGEGEQMFRSLMLDQYGKQIAAQDGFGLSNAITRALLSHQEARS